jgi:hypothetical protein
MHNVADHPAVINPPRAALPTQQQRLDATPLRITPLVNLLCHPNLPIASESLNHKSEAQGDRYWSPDLGAAFDQIGSGSALDSCA